MLTLTNVTKHHGAEPILAGVSLVVRPRDRIGVVGPNGVGKSTLLRVLAGVEAPDSGSVRRTPAALTVGYLPQEAQARAGETLLEYLLRCAGGSGNEWDVAADAGAASSQAGLRPELLDRPVESFSGGEAARAALAAIFAARFDVLLLDEPTNDLDFEGLDRLERFVAGTPAAVVVVSHDRAFLDRTVTRIVELDDHTHDARDYAGGWSKYEAERSRARARHYDRWEQSVEERRRIEEQAQRMRQWEERGYGQGRKKKKSKDVKKAYAKKLERVEVVEKPWEPWELHLGLWPAQRSGDVVARLEEARVERDGFRLGPIDLELSWRDRLALLGPNGSGKTTLLHALLGSIPLAGGSRYVGPGVVLGELDQERVRFAGGEPLIAAFCRESRLPEEDARTLLAKFDLGAGDVVRPGATLSPGERTRAALALLAARGVNCLVLDEPTNHLDLPAIEELERAVAGYEGTVVLVTHDRRFLEAFAATRTLQLASPHLVHK